MEKDSPPQRAVSRANAATYIKAPTPDLLFTPLGHLEGECIQHPWSKCACEAVQTPILDQRGAWHLMGQRFKDSRNTPSPRDHPVKERLPISLSPSRCDSRTASVPSATRKAVQTPILDQGKTRHFMGQRLPSASDHPAKELLSPAPSPIRRTLRTASDPHPSTPPPASPQRREWGWGRKSSLPSPTTHSQHAAPLPRIAPSRKSTPLVARDALRGSPAKRNSYTAGTRGGVAYTRRLSGTG
ncbi:hypothetical protein T484DRAFT_1924282 [Baffinella frigidus]|nr:hypothetical protein T484DRAFT_1924282 [Cryptophyta sp. CCMP2293]